MLITFFSHTIFNIKEIKGCFSNDRIKYELTNYLLEKALDEIEQGMLASDEFIRSPTILLKREVSECE